MNRKFLLKLFFVFFIFSAICRESVSESVWNRNIQLGFRSYKGNTESYEVDFGMAVNFKQEPWKLFFDFESAYVKDVSNDKRTTDYAELESNNLYSLSSRYHLTIHGLIKRDEIANLRLRSQVGPGIGVSIYNTDSTNINSNLIFAYTYERYTEEESSRFLEFKIKTIIHHSLNHFINFDLDSHYGVNQEKTSDYSIELNPAINIHLSSKHCFSIGLKWNYDHEPPLNAKQSTFTTTSKLIISF